MRRLKWLLALATLALAGAVLLLARNVERLTTPPPPVVPQPFPWEQPR